MYSILRHSISEFYHVALSFVLMSHTTTNPTPWNAVGCLSFLRCILLRWQRLSCNVRQTFTSQTLSGNTQTAGGRSDGILAWTSSRLKNTVETIASREWQLIKHDIEEFVTPAWVNQEKQRAEYLSRVARAERRMGRVRLARLEKIVQG